MTPRVQDLVLQAGTDTSGKWMRLDQVEKFAQLIVRECADQVDWILAEGGKTQGDLIREHFGVEQ